jgi:hypothetical protein
MLVTLLLTFEVVEKVSIDDWLEDLDELEGLVCGV